jgi:predicted nucleic acid-binding protein
MAMTLLDSNTIIYLSKKLIPVDDVFSDKENKYAISVITYMEVLGYDFDAKDEEEFIKEMLSYLDVLYIDESISHKVIEIKRKNKIKLPDAIICATAILNKATLVTNDIRLKNISKLKLKIVGI